MVDEVVVYNITASDENDFMVTLEGILPPIEDYSFTQEGDQFVFVWKPTSHAVVSFIFIANDTTGLSAQLHPLVRLCACALDKGATCVASEEDGGEDRFVLEECECGPGWKGRFCNIDIDGCESSDCPTGTNCTDRIAPDTGFDCGPCPDGYIAEGNKCEGIIWYC